MRYITRNIKSVIAITKCANLETLEVEDCTFSLGKVAPEKIERTINKMLDGTNLKLVKVVGTTTEENKYKISEEDFIKYATIVE